MKKLTNTMAILFAAAVMVMIMAVPAFAVTGSAGYVVGTPTSYSNPITVKIIIQSRHYLNNSDRINIIDDVELGEADVSGQTFTVGDVLVAYNESNLDDIEAQTSDGEAIASTQSILYNFSDFSSGVEQAYTPLLYGNHGYTNRIKLDGWRFRVNGRFPLTSWTGDHNLYPEGADTSHTYVKDGDVIYFYTDHPWSESGTLMTNRFVSANTEYEAPENQNDNGLLTIKLYSNKDYYSNWNVNTFPWTVGTFSRYYIGTDHYAYVVEADGSPVGSVLLEGGFGELECTLDDNEKYYVYVNDITDFRDVTCYSGSTGSATLTVNHLARTIAYDLVQH